MLLLLFPQLSELVRFGSFASVRNIKKKMLIKNYLSGMKKVFLNQNKKLFVDVYRVTAVTAAL